MKSQSKSVLSWKKCDRMLEEGWQHSRLSTERYCAVRMDTRPGSERSMRCMRILHMSENKYLCGSHAPARISLMLRVSVSMFSIVKTDSEREESITELLSDP